MFYINHTILLNVLETVFSSYSVIRLYFDVTYDMFLKLSKHL